MGRAKRKLIRMEEIEREKKSKARGEERENERNKRNEETWMTKALPYGLIRRHANT